MGVRYRDPSPILRDGLLRNETGEGHFERLVDVKRRLGAGVDRINEVKKQPGVGAPMISPRGRHRVALR